MGKLKAVWAGFDDPDDKEDLQIEFNRYFGMLWEEVMLAADKSFDYHQYWDGYFAVTDFKLSKELTLWDLPEFDTEGRKISRYNIIVG